MALVNYFVVIGKDGKTPEQRFAEMTKEPKTFYAVNSRLYFGEIELTNESDIDLSEVFAAFGTVQESTTASKTYKVGDLLVFNDKLYRVIQPIVNGGTIVVGSNVTATTVSNELENKTNYVMNGPNGRSLIFNEAEGGGAKFEHSDGTWSFVGVNDGGENGLTGQIYTVKQVNDKYVGTRINMTKNGFYYLPNKDSSAYTAADEIATLGDIDVASEDKKVYLKDETPVGSPYAKVYKFYQGADEVDMSNNNFIGEIDLAKDAFVQDGHVVTVINHVDSDGDATSVVDGVYIKLTLQNVAEPLYIAVDDLVDAYTAQPNATQIQLAISNTNEISATVVAGSIGETELSSDVVTKLNRSIGVSAVTESVTPGSIDVTVDGVTTSVPIFGLGTAAFSDATSFDSAGSAAAVSTYLGTLPAGAEENNVVDYFTNVMSWKEV